MARDLSNEVQYYYDSHPTEEDLMGETSWHANLIDYLKAVLIWLFREQTCVIHDNLNFYQTLEVMEYPLAPDLAVIKGVEFEHMRSWKVNRTGPPPHVIFEILSEETWKKDLREKPGRYARMGTQEYFAYDPNEPAIQRAPARRLRGWRLDTRRGEMVEMIPNAAGWIWSEQLESWLVPDQAFLRLYDRDHQLRLTGEEAQARRAEASDERAEQANERFEQAITFVEQVNERAEQAIKLVEQASERAEQADKRAEQADERTEQAIKLVEQANERAEQADKRTEQAIKLVEQANERTEQAIKLAEQASKQAKILAEKLRSLGLDPDALI